MTCDWYKDAVIYEVFVRAFVDSNGDGIGDLPGLTTRLDYLHDLGVNTLWLLPITPSPLRDHGYDVSNYTDIHPDYGTLDDFRAFLAQAHQRSLRVVVELVPNHTSDQHPWFQASRDPNHPEHSTYRDWYVWSETNTKYKDARIIFLDYEPSNWTYDSVRGAYYWHRFFHHQPDLNYDNPAVQRAMMRVMHFWIDQGVDGIRVDAPPYLFEREGTNCENLPETHAYLKRLRAFVEAYAPDTMLLFEANQMPEEVRAYFGDGDECHMSFHFPLMPRIYLALAQANRAPIEGILARTPALPPSGQWATFLRNHDELTLEMVAPDEREFMWNFYAPDPRARLNLGIRRRLAPLLANDPHTIQVANSILLTLIGSPVLYYGDEIGMGDDIALDDRAGVRTPMQWDVTANAGFSKASPEELYAPVIDDPTFGFEQVNVASQLANPGSLLQWFQGVLAVRRQHPAFGRGTIRLLALDAPAVLAYTREYVDETLVIFNNLSPSSQNVAIDFTAGQTLIDLFTSERITFPTQFTLEGHGYRWFRLS